MPGYRVCKEDLDELESGFSAHLGRDEVRGAHEVVVQSTRRRVLIVRGARVEDLLVLGFRLLSPVRAVQRRDRQSISLAAFP